MHIRFEMWYLKIVDIAKSWRHHHNNFYSASQLRLQKCNKRLPLSLMADYFVNGDPHTSSDIVQVVQAF